MDFKRENSLTESRLSTIAMYRCGSNTMNNDVFVRILLEMFFTPSGYRSSSYRGAWKTSSCLLPRPLQFYEVSQQHTSRRS